MKRSSWLMMAVGTMLMAGTTVAVMDSHGPDVVPMPLPVPVAHTSTPPAVVAPPSSVHTAGTSLVLRTSLDQSVIANSDQDALLMVELQGTGTGSMLRAPVALAVVIDTSGSMAGAKIEDARSSVHALIDRLHVGDRFTLIRYDNQAHVVLSNQVMGVERSIAHAAVSSLSAAGGTCISCGLDAASGQLGALNPELTSRVVLISDGFANAGTTDAQGLSRIAAGLADRGITTASIGLGDSYDPNTMTAIAEGGRGAYYYLPGAQEIASIFDREFAALASVVARDVTIRVAPSGGSMLSPLGVVGARPFAGGWEIPVGQLGAGQTRQFLFRVQLPAGELGEVARVDAWGTARTGFETLVALPRMLRMDDSALQHASRNTEVLEREAQVASVTEIGEAFARADSGDVAGARDVLMRLGGTLRDRAEETGSEDVRREREQVDALQRALAAPENAPGSSGYRGLQLQNSARGNEVQQGVAPAEMFHTETVR